MWSKRRRAAGLSASGSKTWDPKKREAWRRSYYQRADVRAARAAAMRRYVRNQKLHSRMEARWLTRRAIAAGRLVRMNCERCGAMRSEAHHPDYTQPFNVRWLCRPCHRAEHAKAEGRET